MYRLLLALLVVGSSACAPKTLDFEVEQAGCENLDASAWPESTLEQTQDGADLIFYRDWVEQPSSAIFAPEFEQNGGDVTIREYWQDDGTESLTTCFRPTVVLKSPEKSKFVLFWYVGDESVPFDNIQVEID